MNITVSIETKFDDKSKIMKATADIDPFIVPGEDLRDTYQRCILETVELLIAGLSSGQNVEQAT